MKQYLWESMKKGRLIDGIINKKIDGRLNIIPEKNLFEENQDNINVNNSIKIIQGKIEHKYLDKVIIDKNIWNLNNDINMKDATKIQKYKK